MLMKEQFVLNIFKTYGRVGHLLGKKYFTIDQFFNREKTGKWSPHLIEQLFLISN